VSNPLLASTNLVLFLNKCDILQHKLAAGVRFAASVVSYGDRPNDFESVSKCASHAAAAGRARWLMTVCRSEAEVRRAAAGLLAGAKAVLLPPYLGHGNLSA
jgi:hypothetical protein